MSRNITIGLFGNKVTKEELQECNGEFVLDSICIECVEQEELNGEYGLDCIFLLDKNFDQRVYSTIEVDSYLKVKCEYGIEYYQIAQVRKNSKTRYIHVFARHITTSECLKMFCEDVRPRKLDGNTAIHWIFDNAKGDNWLNVSSNISTQATAYYQYKNVYEALLTADNAFITKWGGEIYRRGFRLSIDDRIGEDRGVSIRSRKNLRGLEVETDLNKLATRIYVKGYDRLTIPEKYIDSPMIEAYSKIYPKEYRFGDVMVKDENNEEGFDTPEQAYEELRKRTLALYKDKKVDIITATYRVDFVELSKTEEYKNYKILETTFLGDTVLVVDETLGVDIKVRVSKREYDCLKGIRINTELSNKDEKEKPPTISEIVESINNLPSKNEILEQAKNQATSLINMGLKDSYVVVRKNEILIMDTPDVNTAIKVWRWNNGGLGYSNTGYYGQFGTAITQDGSIVADFITVGILNAGLIKTGMLKSVNGATWIDMENGSFNFGGEDSNLNFDNKKLEIKNGALSVVNSNGVVTIDGSKQMLRLLTWGNGSIILKAGETAKSVTIAHKLGNSPVFKGQFRFANSQGTIETYENNFMLLNWEEGTANITGRMWVDDNNIYIAIWRSKTAASSGQQTFYYRYFIEEGVKL